MINNFLGYSMTGSFQARLYAIGCMKTVFNLVFSFKPNIADARNSSGITVVQRFTLYLYPIRVYDSLIPHAKIIQK